MPTALRRHLPAFLTAAMIVLVSATPAFGASGSFDRTWGRDVDNAGVLGFESCTFAPQCQTGLANSSGGDMSNPNGVATDAAGNVYVADGTNDRIQRFDSAGTFQRAWGEDVVVGGSTGFEICVNGVDTCKVGATLGAALGGEMDNPSGVATDTAGNVYVADRAFHRIQRFDSAGNFQRAWGEDVINGGGTGFEVCVNGVDTCKAGTTVAPALGGDLGDPSGVATDAADHVYVAEPGHDRVQRFDSAGTFQRAWGEDVIDPASPGDSGAGFEICVAGVHTCKAGGIANVLGGDMQNPTGIATDAASKVYVVDSSHHRMQKFDSAGNFERTWGTNVVSSGPGNTGTGVEICVAANGDTCTFGNPNQLGGEMFFPDDVATDPAGNVYLSDGRDRIQRFDSAGNFQRAWGQDVVVGGGTGFEICVDAATCKAASVGAPALGGEMADPQGLATDAAGSLYVADRSHHRIQKFAADPVPSPPAIVSPVAVPPAAAAAPAATPKRKCKKAKGKKGAVAAKRCKKK